MYNTPCCVINIRQSIWLPVQIKSGPWIMEMWSCTSKFAEKSSTHIKATQESVNLSVLLPLLLARPRKDDTNIFFSKLWWSFPSLYKLQLPPFPVFSLLDLRFIFFVLSFLVFWSLEEMRSWSFSIPLHPQVTHHSHSLFVDCFIMNDQVQCTRLLKPPSALPHRSLTHIEMHTARLYIISEDDHDSSIEYTEISKWVDLCNLGWMFTLCLLSNVYGNVYWIPYP